MISGFAQQVMDLSHRRKTAPRLFNERLDGSSDCERACEQRSGHGEAAFPAMIDPDKQDVALRD